MDTARNRQLDYAMGLTAGRQISYLEQLDCAEQYLLRRIEACERLQKRLLDTRTDIFVGIIRAQTADALTAVRQERGRYLDDATRRALMREAVTP